MIDPTVPAIPEPAPVDAARLAGRAAQAKRARDVVILDLRELTSVCDYFVVCTADSEPQLKAVVEHVQEVLRESGSRPWHVEGLRNRQWVVLDYVHVVVHVFHKDVRDTYLLERLWGDAPRETLDAGE